MYLMPTACPPQVFDLGQSGLDKAAKVAEITDFYASAASATNGREVFRNPSGEKKSSAIKHIAPIGE